MTEPDMEFARAYYHWFHLIQPAPLPETMIGGAPQAYLHHKLGRLELPGSGQRHCTRHGHRRHSHNGCHGIRSFCAATSRAAGLTSSREALAEYERCFCNARKRIHSGLRRLPGQRRHRSGPRPRRPSARAKGGLRHAGAVGRARRRQPPVQTHGIVACPVQRCGRRPNHGGGAFHPRGTAGRHGSGFARIFDLKVRRKTHGYLHRRSFMAAQR